MATEYLNNKMFEKKIIELQELKKEISYLELLVEDIEATEERTSKRNKYSKPLSWDETKIEYRLAKVNYREVEEQLTSAFYKLSENLVRYRKFSYVESDDAVQEGVVTCFKNVHQFAPNKGRAFNYLTTCILNHFRQMYRSAKSYNEFKKKYQDRMMTRFEQQLAKSKIFYKNANAKTKNMG